MQRTLRLVQDEAVIAADNLLALVVSTATDFADSEEVFEEAGATLSRASRRFAAKVDHAARLRAR